MAKAYRFHDVVALNTDAGTVYLPATEARKLAVSIGDVVRSIEKPETFAESNCNGRDVADYSHTADALNVADALRRGLIRAARDECGNSWLGRYRTDTSRRFRTVCNKAGDAIVYSSPRAALAAATYARGVWP